MDGIEVQLVTKPVTNRYVTVKSGEFKVQSPKSEGIKNEVGFGLTYSDLVAWEGFKTRSSKIRSGSGRASRRCQVVTS